MKRWLVLLWVCGAAWLAPALGAAQPVERIFADGNEAYFRGDYAQSVQHYRRLVEAGVHDADVYFNLATAHARLGQLGHAIAYFERSLWLRAGDDAAEEGLTAARALLGKRRAEQDGEAVVVARPPLSEALTAPFSSDGLAFAVLGLNLLFFAVLLIRPRLRPGNLRFGLAFALPVLGLLLVAAGLGLAFKTGLFTDGEPAIVLRESAALREGPDPKAQVRTRAHEGETVRVVRREGGFARVHVSRGGVGWINDKDIEQIRPN